MPPQPPAFLITMDTEGDNLWTCPERITTRNARFVPRFQELCERHALKPTWLTNHEMATCPVFGEFADDVLRRGTAEIGMHLHAWDSPPLSVDGPGGQAYLIEYPEDVMREKIAHMTTLLEDRFQREMLSHRAGRWAFDGRYARLLAEFGYTVDCSVTPHVSWSTSLGDPEGAGGTDFRGFPSRPYFLNLEHIERPGDSPLLEVPMSIVSTGSKVEWLRPDGHNRDAMNAILRQALEEDWPCVEFMLHSSELMPDGSPYFPTEESIETLYEHLDFLFAEAKKSFRGMTLAEFRESW